MYLLQVTLEQALALAAAAEMSSEHPLASAIVTHAEAALKPHDTRLHDTQAAAISGAQGSGSSESGERDLSWVWPVASQETLPGRCASQVACES